MRICLRSSVAAMLVSGILLASSQTTAVAQQPKLPAEHGSLEGIVHPTRSRTFDAQHYRFEVRFDETKKSVMGTTTLTLAPFASGFRQFTLDAVDMHIASVTVDGKAQQFKSSRDTLDVLLDREYPALQPITVAIAYECTPKRGLYFVEPSEADPKAPHQVWSQGEMEENRYWLPGYDFPNDKATSEMIATVPASYTVVSNGTLVETRDAGSGMKTWHWRMDKPHSFYLNSIVACELTEIRDEWAGIPVLYYVYPGREEEGRAAFGKTPKMVEFFSERTGYKYPYEKYSQAVLHDFHFGGMENISATSQTDQALQTARQRLDGDVDGLVSHELAHQWFGDLVTAKDWANMWLNESFATFMASVWSEHDKGKDRYLVEMRNDLRNYLGEDAARYRRPIVDNVYEDPIDVFDAHLYPGGAVRINYLRHLLGEELFWRGISHYLHTYAFRNAETTDFKEAFEESTGRELDWFFDEWFFKAGVPEFAVSYRYEPTTKQVVMHVEQRQPVSSLTPIFTAPVDVRVTTASGARAYTVTMDKAAQDVTLPADSAPLAVQFDPEGYVPKTLSFPRSRQELAYLLSNGATALERSDAAEELGAFVRDADVSRALAKALGSDPGDVVRIAAASSLAAVGGDDALPALLAALSDKESTVRVAVVSALESFPAAQVEAPLLKTFREDQSYGVEAAALRTLAKVTAASAPPLLRGVVDDEGAWVGVRSAALDALGISKDPEALALALKYAKVGAPPQLRVMALQTLGAVGKGSAEAFAVLTKQAVSGSFPLRNIAIAALAELGDARALDTLRAVAADDRIDGRLRSGARRAIRRIESAR